MTLNIFQNFVSISNTRFEMSSYNELLEQLSKINESIVSLTKAVTSQSFWNSQLFAAIIGAASAILVIIIHQIINWYRKRSQRLENIFSWLIKQYVFYDPRSLFDQAASTSYVGTSRDNLTGKEEVIPEKPLGEKMIIELRSGLKYWRFPSFKLRRMFKKYEEKLLEFNKCDAQSRDELNEYLARADTIFEKIKDMAFKYTGENEWTT